MEENKIILKKLIDSLIKTRLLSLEKNNKLENEDFTLLNKNVKNMKSNLY